MKKRKAHQLQRMGPGRMPGRIIILQAASKQVYASDADATGHREFAGWALQEGEWYNDKLTWAPILEGRHAADAWRYIAGRPQPEGGLRLVSVDAREVMSIIGFWDAVLRGEVFVDGTDPYSGKDKMAHKRSEYEGYVILEGPPTVVKFAVEDNLPAVTWVDPGNYGATDLWACCDQPPDPSDPAAAGARESWAYQPSIHCLVHIVRQWVDSYVEMLQSLRLGGWEHTAASQASCGYRRAYLDEPIIIHDNELATQVERQALFGGRNECRFIGAVVASDLFIPPVEPGGKPQAICNGEGRIHRLDVNSMYPFVAKDALLPVRLQTVARHVPIPTLQSALANIPVIARVYVESEVPCVPVRMDNHNLHSPVNEHREAYAIEDDEDERIIYPVGRYWTTLCGPELSLAVANGQVLKCSLLLAYSGGAIYTKWVHDLYAARQAAKAGKRESLAACLKNLLNASFGKWAQKRQRWVDAPESSCPFPFYQWMERDAKTRLLTSFRSLAWRTSKLVDAGEPADSFPAIAATISSLGRAHLWSLMVQAGRENVYYYDTDSVWVNDAGLERLAGHLDDGQGRLGALKVEGEYDCVRFYGPKRYDADGAITVAGADVRRCDKSDCFFLQYKAPPIGHYLSVKLPPGTDRIIARNRLNLPYLGGKVQPDGRVLPWRLVDPATDGARA